MRSSARKTVHLSSGKASSASPAASSLGSDPPDIATEKVPRSAIAVDEAASTAAPERADTSPMDMLVEDILVP